MYHHFQGAMNVTFSTPPCSTSSSPEGMRRAPVPCRLCHTQEIPAPTIMMTPRTPSVAPTARMVFSCPGFPEGEGEVGTVVLAGMSVTGPM